MRSNQRHMQLADRQPAGAAFRSGGPVQPAAGRATDAVDCHVGARVRVARKALNLTQEALATQLGITFQQLQKYEKGINRISASRLHHAAKVLGVPVAFFFPETEAAPPAEAGLSQPIGQTMDFLGTMDGVELSRAFAGIEDAAVRRQVIELVRSIAASSQDGQEP
ncbi:MAG TPA: helix-turn-helix domain-containing protein [Afifellaceae bacterium]|nr:helix-turn-helix domain-containing protein [Afifellaceae bacterium]